MDSMGVEALRTLNANRAGIVVAMAANIEDQSFRIGEPAGDGCDGNRGSRSQFLFRPHDTETIGQPEHKGGPDDPLNREGLARWLAATTSLVGVIVLEEPPRRMRQRVKREIKRVGLLRFLDVLAFRVYSKLFLAQRDRAWEAATLKSLCERFAPLGAATRLLHAPSPNAPEVEAFLRESACDLVIARCKTLLKPSVFSIPTAGTFVMHPGICPQYRNAHGCFWALAQNDRTNVGMTLLKIDKGVDTGPVYGFYRCNFDETTDSHHVIQHQVVFDNLDALRDKLLDIHAGQATPLDTRGRPSGEWGQPWLTAFWSYRRNSPRT